MCKFALIPPQDWLALKVLKNALCLFFVSATIREIARRCKNIYFISRLKRWCILRTLKVNDPQGLLDQSCTSQKVGISKWCPCFHYMQLPSINLKHVQHPVVEFWRNLQHHKGTNLYFASAQEPWCVWSCFASVAILQKLELGWKGLYLGLYLKELRKHKK